METVVVVVVVAACLFGEVAVKWSRFRRVILAQHLALAQELIFDMAEYDRYPPPIYDR